METCCTRAATGPPLAALAVDALATYRLTRLLTLDSLPPVKHAREKVRQRWAGSEWSEIATCGWCMSVWVAAGVVAARTLAPRAWTPVARALAMSAVTGWLSSRE